MDKQLVLEAIKYVEESEYEFCNEWGTGDMSSHAMPDLYSKLKEVAIEPEIIRVEDLMFMLRTSRIADGTVIEGVTPSGLIKKFVALRNSNGSLLMNDNGFDPCLDGDFLSLVFTIDPKKFNLLAIKNEDPTKNQYIGYNFSTDTFDLKTKESAGYNYHIEFTQNEINYMKQSGFIENYEPEDVSPKKAI